MVYPNLDVSEMFVEREAQRSSMHTRHLNEQLVRVLKTIGYDVGFQRGIGQYLFDRDGARYLDLLSGFGVFAIGRNHPVMRNALKSVLDADMPNLVQMDVSTLAGILSEKLLENVPYMDKVFFANSGAETVEAAIKFARNATGRDGIVYCDHAYHGLTYGALSLTDDTNFRTGFGPLLSGCTTVPFNDLEALEKALSSKQVAGFIVEPIQGKGVNLPTDEFLSGAAALCRKYGTLFIADEIQTGLGRTGKFLAIEHWNVEPDMILLAKALSGGHVPVGALLTRKSIFDKIFNRMDRSLVHGSTFGKNDLAMAAGIATLEIMKHEKLVENAAKRGAELRLALQNMIPEFELLKEVRGKGLMIGVEFGPPKSLRLKASWNILESASKGLFCQLITVPLFKEQKILTQVSGHGSHTIKLLPPLVVTEDDGKWIENSFRTVIADSHKVPGAIWSLGKTLVDNAVRKSA
ncbi:aminobacteriohopanetriol synthase HpnO [Tardiphaga sp. 1201_B9_N1_1]|jgi:ornithine--oxo-acid transaminase|uniref:aminobacteriohopanetriol synthase HpnO n=1 Tax=Tardiphaga TaxID=1395974 RepID=UPI0008A72958|nr:MULTISPECIES: aminobacteriohopanetriol synthase HpnO [Tardiphaga]NUU42962.1 aminobacteriohopanetriol synthase HpnO [Tardiphaga robiniae]UFS76992.1 aminobacteriohopanetriol synthase HpnO [Tardiphaga sp. 37S4]WPO40648.1 aminobacteriohopanetriol synthase HpnO [Tardiphaga sp. 42S5]SEH43536.1 ornithine--oxo-acid transaminase [Tardiphaga sp. OK245]SNT35977.1 ornithine--oxo-acid transaminase [Tardiphaga sp. OK246]